MYGQNLPLLFPLDSTQLYSSPTKQHGAPLVSSSCSYKLTGTLKVGRNKVTLKNNNGRNRYIKIIPNNNNKI